MAPEIIFRYSAIYDRMIYFFTSSHTTTKPDYFKDRKKACLKAIEKLEKQLSPIFSTFLNKIERVLGIDWNTKEITIYVLPDWHKPIKSKGFSDPLTIVLNRLEDKKPIPFEVIKYIIIHELSHVIQRPLNKTKYYEDLMKKGIKNILVRNHLLTFSIIKKVIGDNEYYKFTKMHHKNEPYKKALDLVEEIGEDRIIAEAKTYLK